MPAGVALNPSGADGLEACSSNPGALGEGTLGSPGDQIGYQGEKGFETSPGLGKIPAFTPYMPGSLAAIGGSEGHGSESEATLQPGVNFCPNASEIGEVTIHSPLLPVNQPVTGYVYFADQEANPFGR